MANALSIMDLAPFSSGAIHAPDRARTESLLIFLRQTMRIRTVVSALVAAILLPLLFTPSVAQPRIRGFGFGIMLGDPLAITVKGSLGGTNSWDAAIGSSWFGSPR